MLDYIGTAHQQIINLMEKKMYYKYVTVRPDGKRVSTFQYSMKHWVKDCKVLEYKPNRIISAPKESAGIFISEELRHTKDGAVSISSVSEYMYPVEVYEVKNLSPVTRFNGREENTTGEGFLVCSVIRVGKLLRRWE